MQYAAGDVISICGHGRYVVFAVTETALRVREVESWLWYTADLSDAALVRKA